jgi:hypothetical protein
MTQDEFKYWLQGMMASSMAIEDKIKFLLREAKAQLGMMPTAPEPPAMVDYPVGSFCIHNINLAQPCRGCELTGIGPEYRIFGVALKSGTKQVFTHKEVDGVDVGAAGRVAGRGVPVGAVRDGARK